MFVDYSSQNKFMSINYKFADKYLEMLHIEKLSSPENRLECLKVRTEGLGIKIIQNLEINDFAGDFNWIVYLYGLVLSKEQMLECGETLLSCPTLYMVEFALQGCRIEDAFSEESTLSSQLKLAIKCAYYEFIGPCEKIIYSLKTHFLSLRPRYDLPFNKFGYFQKVLYNEMFTDQAGNYKIHAGLLIMPSKFPSSYRILISEEGYPKSNIKVRFHKWSGYRAKSNLNRLEMNDVKPFCIENKVISVWKQGHSSELFGHYSYMLRLGKLPSNEEPPSETTVVMKDIKARSAKRTEKLRQFEDFVSSGNSWSSQKGQGVSSTYKSADPSFGGCQNSFNSKTDPSNEVLEFKARPSKRSRILPEGVMRSDSTACNTSIQGHIVSSRCGEQSPTSFIKENCTPVPIEPPNTAGDTNAGPHEIMRKTSSGVYENNKINSSLSNKYSRPKGQQTCVLAQCEKPLLPKKRLLVKSGTAGYREMTELEKDIYHLLEIRQTQKGVRGSAPLPSRSDKISAEKAKRFQQVRQALMENEEEFLFSSKKAGPPLSGDGVIDRHLKIAASTSRPQNAINPNLVKSLKPVSEIVAIIEKAEKVVAEQDLVQQLEGISQELKCSKSLESLSSSTLGKSFDNYSTARCYSSPGVPVNERGKNKTIAPVEKAACPPGENPLPNASIVQNRVTVPLDKALSSNDFCKFMNSSETLDSEQSVIIRRHLFSSEHEVQSQVYPSPEGQKENNASLSGEFLIEANSVSSSYDSSEIPEKCCVRSWQHITEAKNSTEAKKRPERSSCEAVFSYEPSDSNPERLKDLSAGEFSNFRNRNSALLTTSKDSDSYSASQPCSPTFSDAASLATSHTRPLDLKSKCASGCSNNALCAKNRYCSIESGYVATELPVFKINENDPDLLYRVYMADPRNCLGQPEVIFRKPFEQRSNGLTQKLRKFMSSHSSSRKNTKSEPTYQEMYPALSNIRFRDFLRFKSRKLREDVRYFSHVAKLCVTDFKERPITAERELYEQFK